MEPNHIYQYSLLNALMSGVCETGITASALLSKSCNQGLGTFARMNGELVLIDDKIYRLESHGRVSEADPSDQIPFAMAINFVPHEVQRVELQNKTDIDAELGRFTPHSKNLFISYRIDGTFAHLKCRTVRGQQYPGQPLSELGKLQSVEEYEDVKGSVIGFRSPENWQGFSVAGEHLHFISEDRTKGGHVLELRTLASVDMKMAIARNVHVELPLSEDFNAATLVTNDEEVKAVEG